MPLRIFGLWCLVFGHKRAADSRRSLNGSVFADCSVCGRELYRDPVTTAWRRATDQDRRPRGFSLDAAMPGEATDGEAATARPKKRSRRSARR